MRYRFSITPGDWIQVERALNLLSRAILTQGLLTTSTPEFAGLTLTGFSGLLKATGGTVSAITDSSSNWNTAYTDRLKWDGGATGLTAATGRTSLELGETDCPRFGCLTLAEAVSTGVTSPTSAGTYLYNGIGTEYAGSVKFYCAAQGLYLWKNASGNWVISSADETTASDVWYSTTLNGAYTALGACTGSPVVEGIGISEYDWQRFSELYPLGTFALKTLNLGNGTSEYNLTVDGIAKMGLIIGGGGYAPTYVPSYIVGGIVNEVTNPGATGNTANTETDLVTFTLPIDSFVEVGDTWKIHSFGITSGSVSTNKRIRVYLGGTNIFDITGSGSAPGIQFQLDITVIKYDTDKQSYCVSYSTTAGAMGPKVTTGQTTIDDGGEIILKITGSGTNANDVIIYSGKLIYEPSRNWIL